MALLSVIRRWHYRDRLSILWIDAEDEPRRYSSKSLRTNGDVHITEVPTGADQDPGNAHISIYYQWLTATLMGSTFGADPQSGAAKSAKPVRLPC
jgi:hypothetical protein